MTHLTLCFHGVCDVRRLNVALEETGLWNCMNEFRAPDVAPKADGIHALVVTDSKLTRLVYKASDGMVIVSLSIPKGITLEAIQRVSDVVTREMRR